jgi:enoyl-CoA hydratase/carnithine racemase
LTGVQTGTLRLRAEGAIARVELSHRGKLNAMSRAMWRQLRDTFTDLQHSATVRCIVIEGEGEAFCAGGDISEYAQFRFQEDSLRAFHEQNVWGGLQAMLDCDVPIVASIRGACMGAGMESWRRPTAMLRTRNTGRASPPSSTSASPPSDFSG